jgi:hypothetical protein
MPSCGNAYVRHVTPAIRAHMQQGTRTQGRPLLAQPVVYVALSPFCFSAGVGRVGQPSTTTTDDHCPKQVQ